MGIGERMVGGPQAIEFADKGEARARRVAPEAALDPGECEPGLRLEAEAADAFGHQRRGLASLNPVSG